MAEARRVHLTTLSPNVPPSCDEQPSAHKLPSGVFHVEETCPDPAAGSHTVRLVVALFEPDERSFPEFSYNELIENKISHTKDQLPVSRFEEEKRDNDELEAIARRLEEKYGGKTKKRDRIQDLIDIGYGYDEEDSFIDNSEPYDEFVPASITTKFGGFYVNSGVLQFRQASDTETETEDLATGEKKLKHSKKRKLNDQQNKPKKKRCRENGEMKNNVDSKSSTLSNIGPKDEQKKKKKKRNVGTLSVTSMLKKFQKEKEKERLKTERASQKAAVVPAIPLCPADAAGGGGSGLTDPLLSLIGSTNDNALIQAASTVDFDIDLDTLLEVSEETLLPKPLSQPIPETLSQPPDDQIQLNVSAKAQIQNTKTYLQPTKAHPEQNQLLLEATSPHQHVSSLEGFPPGLEESIRKLMVAAKTLEGESKLKFFTPEINSILLEIELQCRDQGGQVRSKVYTHVSSFLPCSRDTLLKRVKKLLLSHMEEPPDVEDTIQKLKEAIGRAMTEQIACYHENCQAYEQSKASKPTEEGKEGSVVTEENVEEKGGKRGGPKKLFKWNEEIRECLYNVLRPKIETHTKEIKGSQEMDDYLKTLLDNEVKPLWPKGWMQSRVLISETRKLLRLFNSLPVKKARSDKKQSSISSATTVSDVVQGTPPPKEELPQEKEGSDISSSTFLSAKKEGAASKRGECKKGVDSGSSSSAESGKPLVSATAAPAHSLLDLLADHALAQEQPLTVPQELLTAAVAKYQHSFQRWSLGVDNKSPPLPPPPPQSSPVSFPVSATCQVGLAQRPHGGGFASHIDTDCVQEIADDGVNMK